MDAQLVFILLALLAFFYAAFSSFVSNTLGNRKRVSEIQNEMKKINKDHLDALKSGNKDDLAKAEKAQSERLPQLLKESMELQFKPLIPTLLIFFLVFYYLLPTIAPDANDDVKLELFDDGLPGHCDARAGDGVYSSCFAIPDKAANGTWIASARAVKSGGFLFFSSEENLGENSTLFTVGSAGIAQRLPALPQHNSLAAVLTQTDKTAYLPGEKISISAKVSPSANATVEKVHASLDSGTRFWIDSSLDIPFLGKELHSSGLFILFILASSIIIQITMALQKKLSKKQ